MTTAEIEAAVEAKRETFRDQWTPTGMNAFDFRRKFPWADPPRTNGLDGVPLAEGEAWMNYGPESKARHLLRAESNAEFLRSLQKEMRNDELVVCVSHGAIMGTTVRNPGSSTPLPPFCSPLTSDLRACVGGRCVRCWASSVRTSSLATYPTRPSTSSTCPTQHQHPHPCSAARPSPPPTW